MTFYCECVYRRIKKYRTRFRKGDLIVSKQYKKLMKIVGKALKEGKEVQLDHKIVFKSDLDFWKFDWYDKITVTIK